MNLSNLHVIPSKGPSLLADRLRELILQGQYVSGDMLPAERDLVIESGLSRGSVREALKILETEGLIEIRTGRSGGARVTTPKRDLLARSVEVFVRTRAVELESLLDCRLAVEPMLARRAARNRTEAELEELRQLHAKFAASVDRIKKYREINFQWHLAIARASRNDPLIALMEAISTPVLEATDYENYTTPKSRRDAVKAHAAVMNAIAARDEEAAANAMHDHLSVYTKNPGRFIKSSR